MKKIIEEDKARDLLRKRKYIFSLSFAEEIKEMSAAPYVQLIESYTTERTLELEQENEYSELKLMQRYFREVFLSR